MTNFLGFTDFEKAAGPLSTRNVSIKNKTSTDIDEVISGRSNLKNLDLVNNDGRFKTILLDGFLKKKLTVQQTKALLEYMHEKQNY